MRIRIASIHYNKAVLPLIVSRHCCHTCSVYFLVYSREAEGWRHVGMEARRYGYSYVIGCCILASYLQLEI
jgi:hypothetical protein